MKKTFIKLCLLFVLCVGSSAQPNDEILSLLKERVDIAKLNQSIAVAVIEEKDTKFINYGKISQKKDAPNADQNTIYEIGSITKVFTGILLAEAIKRREVKADDPISKFLPKTVKTPTRNGQQITLLDLVTHTSGLPRDPENANAQNISEISKSYTVKQLYDLLSKYQPTTDIGTKYLYSNIGIGLLGHILCLQAKMSFPELVKKRIFAPLKMNDSTIVVSPKQRTKLAAPFTEDLELTIENGDSEVFLPVGSIRSTSADMAKFAAANLGLVKTPITDSLMTAQMPSRNGTSASLKIGYAWEVYSTKDFGNFVLHNGDTFGFSSSIVFDKERKRGVIVLTNRISGGAGSLARYIFDAKFPKPKFVQPIAVSEDVLQKYVGVYELAPDVTLTVSRKSDKLFAEVTGQGSARLYAKTQTEFFFRVEAAGIVFNADENGKIVSLTLLQGGQKIPAKRIK